MVLRRKIDSEIVDANNVVKIEYIPTITSAKIGNGAIINEDINAAAAIDGTKLSAGWQKDVTGGIPSLHAGDVSLIQIVRNAGNNIGFREKTSDETAFYINRVGATDYDALIQESGVFKKIQTEGMKDVASGIAGLDASSLLALTQQRVNFKIGSFTKNTADASGNVAYTGVGFQPRFVLFFASVTSTPELSIGLDNGSAPVCIRNIHTITANAWAFSSPFSISLAQVSGVTYTGSILSFDSDGFTIAWTKTGAKVGTADVLYLAMK